MQRSLDFAKILVVYLIDHAEYDKIIRFGLKFFVWSKNWVLPTENAGYNAWCPRDHCELNQAPSAALPCSKGAVKEWRMSLFRAESGRDRVLTRPGIDLAYSKFNRPTTSETDPPVFGRKEES
ncbi:hypothetical protein Trydic_g12696 [Trypoxylus dichotomus]